MCPLGGSHQAVAENLKLVFVAAEEPQRKAPCDANVWHQGALLGDLQMFPNLIIRHSASFDMDPHRNDFVPDNALIDEDTVVNRTCKTPVIMEFIIY